MILATKYRDEVGRSLDFIFGYVTNIGNEERVISLQEILTDNTTLSELISNREDIQVNLDNISQYVLPRVSKLDEDKDGVLYLTEDDEEEDDYSLIQLSSEDKDSHKFSDILEIIKEENPDTKLSSNDLVNLVQESYECITNIINNNFIYLIENNRNLLQLPNYPTLKKTIMSYNDTSHGEKINYAESKRTKINLTEQDTPLSQVSAFVPKRIYYANTPEYEMYINDLKDTILKNTPVIKPYGDLDNVVTSANFKKLLKNIKEEFIFGNSEMNNLPIQSNEMALYESLNILIINYIKSYCEANSLPAGSEEDYYKNWSNLTELISILNTYIIEYVQTNWSHCYKIPVSRGRVASDDVERDNDSDDSIEDMQESDEYSIPEEKFTIKNGQLTSNIAIFEYTEVVKSLLISNGCSIFGYSEAIIKLARWGERKPDSLILNTTKSKSTQKYELDLNEFDIRLSEASFSEIIKQNGRSYSLIGFMKQNKEYLQLKDNPDLFDTLDIVNFESNPEFITGIICQQGFISSGEPVGRLALLDLTYVISQYRNGVYDINGLDLVDGKFKIDKSVFEGNDAKEYTVANHFNIFKNSTNKAEITFVNDIINLTNTLDTRIILSRDDWKNVSLTGTVSNILDTNKYDVKKDLASLFIGDFMTTLVRSALIKPYIDYICEVKVTEEETGTVTPEDCLNIFNQCYNKEAISKLSKINPEIAIKNKSRLSNNETINRTSNFEKPKKKMTLKPVHSFSVANRTFYTVMNINPATNGICPLELVLENTEEYEYDLANLRAKKSNILAQYNLFALSMDNSYKNKTFVTAKAKDEIFKIKNELYGESLPIEKLLIALKNEIEKHMKK